MRRAVVFLNIFMLAAACLVFPLSAYAQPPAGGRDRDNNPPGPKGGPGTNWENPPGPKGGPGASPDRQVASTPAVLEEKAVVNQEWEKLADTNNDGVVDSVEIKQWRDRESAVNPGWEKLADTNNDGVVDQTEMKQWQERPRDKDNNPPGPKGGPGTNWENPPGPKGGPGASPD